MKTVLLEAATPRRRLSASTSFVLGCAASGSACGRSTLTPPALRSNRRLSRNHGPQSMSGHRTRRPRGNTASTKPGAVHVAQKLISSHLVSGEMNPGSEIGLRIDQTLTQDATGTVVMLELEAMTLDRVRTEVSVQYVDHNLLQAAALPLQHPQARRIHIPAGRRGLRRAGSRPG
jgi:hypothetical protein